MDIITYEDNGMIIATLSSDDQATIDANKTGNWVDGTCDKQANYIDPKTKAITPRPTQATAYENNQLINLPVPCEVYIDDQLFECDTDTLVLDIDPAPQFIKVVAFPYLDWNYQLVQEYEQEEPAEETTTETTSKEDDNAQ